MRFAPPGHRAYTYKVTVPPVNSAVSLTTFKNHIKAKGNSENVLLKLYLETAIEYAEKLTRRDFITRTYQTFRDFFPVPAQNEGYYNQGVIPSFTSSIGSSLESNVGYEIRKSPLQSIESVEYYVSGVLETVDTAVYYNTVEEDYSELLTNEDQCWPEDADRRQQAVVITFKTGFGDSCDDVPAALRDAILMHATALWANRGDCDDASCAATVPAASRIIYMQNRIENL